jgi:hypothetical protein
MKLFLYILLLFFLCFYVSICGLGLTPDSYAYIAAAQSFAKSYQFVGTDGQPYIAWAPLYPIILSFFTSNILKGAIYVQFLCMLIHFICFYQVVKKLVKNKWIQSWAILQIIFSPYLFLVFAFLWSEITFIAILWLLIYYLIFMYEKIQKYKKIMYEDIFVIGLLSNFLCLQRNTGIFFVFLIVIFLFIQNYILLRKTANKHLKIFILPILYGSFSSICFIAWHIRCELLSSDKINFTENIFDFPLWHVLYFATHRMTIFILPPQIPYPLRMLIFILLLCFVTYHTYKISKNKDISSIYYFFPILVIGYIIILISLLRNFDADGDRYLAPIHSIFVLCLGIFCEKVMPFLRYKKIVTLCLALFLLYPITRSIKNIEFWHHTNCSIIK